MALSVVTGIDGQPSILGIIAHNSGTVILTVQDMQDAVIAIQHIGASSNKEGSGIEAGSGSVSAGGTGRVVTIGVSGMTGKVTATGTDSYSA